MKSFEVPENFYEQGFVIIRNVLSSNEIGDLRSFIQNKLAVHDNPRTLSPSNTYLYPELYLLPFQEKVVKSLKQILGEQLCYFPNLSIQHSTFGNPGWHTDA